MNYTSFIIYLCTKNWFLILISNFQSSLDWASNIRKRRGYGVKYPRHSALYRVDGGLTLPRWRRWGFSVGRIPGEAKQDEEGIAGARYLNSRALVVVNRSEFSGDRFPHGSARVVVVEGGRIPLAPRAHRAAREFTSARQRWMTHGARGAVRRVGGHTLTAEPHMSGARAVWRPTAWAAR
jgi:hypothetical protein